LEESHKSPQTIKYFLRKLIRLDQENKDEEESFLEQDTTRISIIKVLFVPKVLLSLLCYGAVTFIYIQYDEVFALWSRLPYENGGLDFESSDQGIAFSIGGFLLLFYQLFIFVRVERALGVLNTFRTGVLFSLPAFFIMPFLGLTIKGNGHSEWLLWILIGICQTLRNVSGVQAFTATFMMISNSVSSKYRGAINGFGQTLASFSRMCGPVFAGSLFSWSLENKMGFPFDFHFMFLVLTLMLIFIYVLSFVIGDEINQRETEDDQDDQDDQVSV
jgi:hypothetical protein